MLNDRRFCGPASGFSSSGKTLHRSIHLLARAMLLAAAPYRASGLVRWHKADVTIARPNVRSRTHTGSRAF